MLKMHLITMRNSQNMDHLNMYLQFWGHMLLGDSVNKFACTQKHFQYIVRMRKHATACIRCGVMKYGMKYQFVNYYELLSP